jgi:hypothetical protein
MKKPHHSPEGVLREGIEDTEKEPGFLFPNWRFFQVLATVEAWPVDPGFQKAIHTGHPIQASPGDKI